MVKLFRPPLEKKLQKDPLPASERVLRSARRSPEQLYFWFKPGFGPRSEGCAARIGVTLVLGVRFRKMPHHREKLTRRPESLIPG